MPPSPPSSATDRRRQVLLIVGGGMTALGSLLPWATVSTLFGTINVAGTSGDGVITLLLGLGIVLAGVAAWDAPRRVNLGWVVAGITGAVALYDLVNVSRISAEASSAVARASAGIGLWLTVAGAGVALAGLVVAPRGGS